MNRKSNVTENDYRQEVMAEWAGIERTVDSNKIDMSGKPFTKEDIEEAMRLIANQPLYTEPVTKPVPCKYPLLKDIKAVHDQVYNWENKNKPMKKRNNLLRSKAPWKL